MADFNTPGSFKSSPTIAAGDFKVDKDGGGLTNLGLANRFEIFKSNINIIKKYTIGYCEGGEIMCRPKPNEVAVMFLKDGNYFWTHITKKEFDLLNLSTPQGGMRCK